VELAHFARQCYPDVHVIMTSGLALKKTLPEGATFMPKPWLPLDVVREAQRSWHRRHDRAVQLCQLETFQPDLLGPDGANATCSALRG
jgi:hypothetical protein